jgi:hypothetical protein
MQKYQPDHWQLGSGLPNMLALSRREFVLGAGATASHALRAATD